MWTKVVLCSTEEEKIQPDLTETHGVFACRVVTISDFHCMVIVAKQISDNCIIAIFVECF